MGEDTLIQEYVSKYTVAGEHRFYNLLIILAIHKLILLEKGSFKGTTPEIELLNLYDKFIILYKRNGEDDYLKVAKTFRKAAHKVYRIMLKKKLTNYNIKFLNLV